MFRTYAEYSTFYHQMLFEQIASWLSGELNESVRDTVLVGTREALVVLNEHRWDRSDGSSTGPWAFLLFPVIQWAIGGQTSTASEVVFLRGIKFTFAEGTRPYGYAGEDVVPLMAALDPLLRKAPREIICASVRRGVESPDPAVRAFCHLICSLADSPTVGATRSSE